MLTRDDATTRVARGAAHLDQVRPGWFARIDVGTLTLSDPCGCIVGQLCGTGVAFGSGLLALAVEDCVEMGFERPTISLHDAATEAIYRARHREQYAFLQDAWIAAIADRVLAAAQSTEQPPSTNAVREETEQPFVPLRV